MLLNKSDPNMRDAHASGELFLSKDVLQGVVPECLLKSHHFYHDMKDESLIRGYPLNSKGEEQIATDLDHWLIVRLANRTVAKHTGAKGIHAFIARISKGDGGSLSVRRLVDLLFAEEGSAGFVVAQLMSRIENLSHVLAWSNSGSAVDLVELPRLGISFTWKSWKAGNEAKQLVSKEFKGMRVTTPAPVEKLHHFRGIPHSLLLQDQNDDHYILVPFVATHRPSIAADLFSSELVLERENRVWRNHETKVFLYEVHLSGTFMHTQTLTAALYLLLLKFQHRLYDQVSQLVRSIATDSPYQEEARHVFQHLGSLGKDQHADAHAARIMIAIATGDANMRLPMRLDLEMACYVQKLAHVSAQCRLKLEEEIRALELIDNHARRLQIANQHLQSVHQREQAEKAECPKFAAKLQALLRSASLPMHLDDATALLMEALRWKELPQDMVATLSNRKLVLESLQTGSEPVHLVLPKRGTASHRSVAPGSVFHNVDRSVLHRSNDTIARSLLAGGEIPQDLPKKVSMLLIFVGNV